MYTLYIDTHFVNLVIGLFKDDELLVEKKLESNKHSENTISLLKEVLDAYNLEVKDISEVIVITGPGSFTGVRIGIVIAKLISYTLNIPVKAISYLEAMSLSYDNPVIVGIKDRNGVFVGEFDENHILEKDYYYLSNDEFNNFDGDIILDDNVSLLKIKEFVKTKNAIEPHLLTPLYVKKIEVGK